jgi:hypothetical protein
MPQTREARRSRSGRRGDSSGKGRAGGWASCAGLVSSASARLGHAELCPRSPLAEPQCLCNESRQRKGPIGPRNGRLYDRCPISVQYSPKTSHYNVFRPHRAPKFAPPPPLRRDPAARVGGLLPSAWHRSGEAPPGGHSWGHRRRADPIASMTAAPDPGSPLRSAGGALASAGIVGLAPSVLHCRNRRGRRPGSDGGPLSSSLVTAPCQGRASGQATCAVAW